MTIETSESSVDETTKTAPVETQEETGRTQWFAPEPESEAGENVEESAPEDSTATEDEVAEHQEGDPDTEEESGEEEEQTSKKNGFEKRVQKLNRKIAAAQAEAELWKKQALGQQPVAKEQAPAASVVTSAKPTLQQFHGNIEAYTDALTDWKLSQQRETQQAQTVVQTYKQKEQSFKAEHPDYDEVMAEFADDYKHVNAPEINSYLVESDIGPELYYHLATHTDELDRILKLTPIRRVAELGKIEDRLSKTSVSTPKPAAKKVTKAPAPVTPEKGKPAVAPISMKDVKDVKDLEKISQAEWREQRRKQMKRF